MKKISPLERIYTCLIAINLFAINLIVLISSIVEKNRINSFSIDFKQFPIKSQMTKMIDKGTIKVAIQDNNAYWVIDNILYKANLDDSGRILNEDAERVDVFDLSEKEVTNLLSIIDNINS